MSKGLRSWWEKWSKKNQAHTELKQRLNFLFSLDDLTRAVYQSLDSEVSFTSLASKLRELLAFDYLISFGWKSQNGILQLENCFPEKLPWELKKGDQVKLNSELILQAIQEQKPLSKFSSPSGNSFCGLEKLTSQLKIACAMIFPLIFDSQTTALLLVGRAKPQKFTENELALVEALAWHWAIARKNTRHYEELKEVDQSQRRPNQQSQEAQELKKMKVVTSKTVHDFNNLLATILGRTEILQMKISNSNFPEKENLLKSLSVIEKTVGQGTQLLNSLYQLYKPQPELKELDLKELVEETVQKINSESPQKLSSKIMKVETDEKLSEPDKILADKTELKNALADLLLRTIRFLPSSAKLQIRISENEKQVLAQFKTQPEPSGEEWLGKVRQELGNLAPLLSQHRGEFIWDERRGDTKDLVCICFPRAHPASKKTEAVAAVPVHSVSGQILLFEEQQSLGDILQEYLQFLGYRVKKFKNPKLALEVFNSDKFDLVFTDVGRAGMFGWNFIEQVKKFNPEVPVILIVAKGISFNTSELVKQGIGGVIYKPFDFASIKQTVHDILVKRLAEVKI